MMKMSKATRSKIKKKKVRNETLPLPLLCKNRKTKQAELYTVTKSQINKKKKTILESGKEVTKSRGKRTGPIYQLKRFVVFPIFRCTRYQRCSNSMCQL